MTHTLVPPSKSRAGFSLVEVTLAIGIMSFCLLPLLGLLPIGLSAVKTAREQAAAANCVEQIATAIRQASVDLTGSNQRALGTYSNLAWVIGGTPMVANLDSLAFGGTPTTSELDKRLVARVEIHPPADGYSPGAALISVAWPQSASWNAGSNNWVNAQSSVSTWLIFLPSR